MVSTCVQLWHFNTNLTDEKKKSLCLDGIGKFFDCRLGKKGVLPLGIGMGQIFDPKYWQTRALWVLRKVKEFFRVEVFF